MRLGLPLTTLLPGRDSSTGSAALLVAAAVLLAASGAGALTVGVAARRMTRAA